MQIPLVSESWIRVSVDITGPHPRSSKSNQYILTLVDHFSKWAEAIPLRNHTAPMVARALVIHVFSRFGAPEQLLTDRGTEFESELFKELMRWTEIDKLRTTMFHHASAERRKRNSDINIRSKQFAVGDWVFYHYLRRYQSRSPKWQRSYTGPYLIMRMIEPVNCILQRSAKSKPFVAHFDKLKHCYGETPISWLSADATQTESN